MSIRDDLRAYEAALEEYKANPVTYTLAEVEEIIFMDGSREKPSGPKRRKAKFMNDVVEVVRCKDCYHEEECSWKEFLGEDGYCSAGEECADE